MSAGKGDKRRPRGDHVSDAEYADRWERTFRAKRKGAECSKRGFAAACGLIPVPRRSENEEDECRETPKKSSK